MDTVTLRRSYRSAFWPRALLSATTMLLIVALSPARAESPAMAPELLEKISQAGDFGLIFLRKSQLPDGSWAPLQGEQALLRLGYAALPALTLLECGELPSNLAIKRAAAYVRRGWRTSNKTFELSLSLLLLDRLAQAKAADIKDEAIIHTLALQLIASQNYTGGWGYDCLPLRYLPPQLQHKLFNALRQPPPGADAAAMEGDVPGRGRPGPRSGSGAGKPVNTSPLPAELARLPVLQDPELFNLNADETTQPPFQIATDNFNTLFAILALRAAQRHGIPLHRTMQLVIRRFETSQSKDGGWDVNYVFGGKGDSPPSDCCALLGLAIGKSVVGGERSVKQLSKDPHIVSGFVALSKNIGQPSTANPFFLWALGRLAKLYDLPKLGDKDWFGWGAERLVSAMQTTGVGSYWDSRAFPGSSPVIDTCLAVMFLKKSDLAESSTGKLPIDSNDLSKRITAKLAPPVAATPAPAPVESEPPTVIEAPPAPAVTPPPQSKPAAPTPPQPTPQAGPGGGPGGGGQAQGPQARGAPPQPAATDSKAGGSNRTLWWIITLGSGGTMGLASVLLIWMHMRRQAAFLADMGEEEEVIEEPEAPQRPAAQKQAAASARKEAVAAEADEEPAASEEDVVAVLEPFDDEAAEEEPVAEEPAEDEEAVEEEEEPAPIRARSTVRPQAPSRPPPAPEPEDDGIEVVEDEPEPLPAPVARSNAVPPSATRGRNGAVPNRELPLPPAQQEEDDEVEVIDGLGDEMGALGELPEAPMAAGDFHRTVDSLGTEDDSIEVVGNEDQGAGYRGYEPAPAPARASDADDDDLEVVDDFDDDAVDVLDESDDL